MNNPARRPFLGIDLNAWFGYICGAIVVGFCLYFAATGSHKALDVSIIFTGLAIGWIIGMLASPEPKEADRFERFGKLIAGFLAGFVVSKVDLIWETLAKEPSTFKDDELLERLLWFLIAVVVSLCFPYI
jgi:hypothetical protein